MSQFITGVPTNTTPTLTPTTLRNIEQSISELDQEFGVSHLLMNSGHHSTSSAGSFVPPLPSCLPITVSVHNSWQGGSVISTGSGKEDFEEHMEIKPEISQMITTNTKGSRGGGTAGRQIKPRRGGRKATTPGGRKPRNDKDLTPEEAQRRQIRRERNKLAAARCRKRRVDQTNILLEETNTLEASKRQIQEEINNLKVEEDELKFILEAHLGHCTKFCIKPRPGVMKRPTTLPVPTTSTPVSNVSTRTASSTIPLLPPNAELMNTPSNGLQFGDLDWSTLPSTGMTPTAASASLVTPLITPSTAHSILSQLEAGGHSQQFKQEPISDNEISYSESRKLVSL